MTQLEREDSGLRPYEAMIWTAGSDEPGRRVSVLAKSLKDAMDRLEAEYGDGNVYDLHNEEDAARPR